MSEQEKDQWDEVAEVRLPCVVGQWNNPCLGGDHNPYCPHEYRSAVAAEMRKMGAEIERLTYELLLLVITETDTCSKCHQARPCDCQLTPGGHFEEERKK